MILKSIEIRGFKSFADLTELTFNKGITSVIGPNGSGKSNISDAIRWCLGEQSVRNLRGGKMEDVIFSGTQYRKPLSLAQVSLTIDNFNRELPIDYNMVTISRKLYRSGESEYLINNKPCKLKDINQLFFDTGIGKEGYSLIGQGKIDGILSINSDDRRMIIEEAIGITKYKFKKEEAQNKINHANDNLIRVNDMLNTYIEYLEPLHIESDKAKKFIDLSNELRDIEILLFYNNLYKIYSDINLINNDISKNNEELGILLNKKLGLEYEKLACEKELDNIRKIEEDDRKRFYRIKDIIQKHSDNINLQRNEINILTSSNEIYNKQVSENQVKINNIHLRENIVNKTKLELENEFENLSKELEDKYYLQSSRANVLLDLEKGYEDVRNKQNEIITQNNSIRNKLEIISSSSIHIDRERQSYLDEKSNIENNILKIDRDIKEKQNVVQSLLEDKNKIENLLNSLIEDIGNQDARIHTYISELDNLNRSLIIKQTNLNALKEFESNYEGFSRASKILMNEIKSGSLKRFEGHCFIVGNILGVDEKYALAIETAIGSHISDIIIDDYNFAKDLIDYLKNNKIGRVTFHPLNSVNKFNFKFLNTIGNYKGFLDFAINIVDVEDKFNKVIKNILGNTIICDNIDNALNLAKSINFSNRIVTLDSQVINSGGSITGGSSYSKKFNILGRQDKIQKQVEDIKHQRSLIIDLESKLSQYKNNRSNIQNQIDIANDSLQKINFKILKNNEEIRNFEDLKQREGLEFVKNQTVLDSLSRASKTNTEESLNLNNELDENIVLLKKLDDDYKHISIKLEQHRRLVKDEEDSITDIKIKKGKLEENISNIYEEGKRITLEKSEIININAKINDSIKLNNINIDKLNTKIENFKNRLISLNEDVKKYNFNSYVIDQNKIQDRLKILDTDINDVEFNIHKFEQEINNLKIKISKKEVEFNIINNNLFDKYSKRFDIEEKDIYIVDDNKIKDYANKSNKITNSISDLGSINLKAIEEYETLNNKVNFIIKQKEDLEKSKNELENFINDITLEMRDIFKENFKYINENFNSTFRELFKGGMAQLILGEGDELESKIDIIVQPPGKKLQNINLLSGGEKGLSAIALLFAILKLKPVPFCVLDEIEAALDDNNVIKFANFLKQYSSNVQFIVITHRKPTMESSDIIYGVTMQEKGISKVVSINLANYNM